MKATRRVFMGVVGATALATTAFSGLANAWEPTKPIDFGLWLVPVEERTKLLASFNRLLKRAK